MEEGGKKEKDEEDDEEGEKEEEDEEEDNSGFYLFYYLTPTQSQTFPQHPPFSYHCTNSYTHFLFPIVVVVCVFIITPHTSIHDLSQLSLSPSELHKAHASYAHIHAHALTFSIDPSLSYHSLLFFHYLDL